MTTLRETVARARVINVRGVFKTDPPRFYVRFSDGSEMPWEAWIRERIAALSALNTGSDDV